MDTTKKRQEYLAVSSADTVATLMEIARTLASPRALGEILEKIMEQVSRLLSPKAWSLLLRDEENGELEFAVVVSEVADRLKGVRLPKGHGVAGWVAENGHPLFIPDVSLDERFAAEFDRSVSFRTSSIACVPLKCHNRVLGVIELINSCEKGEFREMDMRVLTTIADFAAIAISNEHALEKVRRLVITDDLTGLYNARYFFEQVVYEVNRARRYGTMLSMVFFDLDKFKSVNDTHGHLVGSGLLAEVGALLRGQIRSSDKGARYGGDEFVVLLPHTDKRGAMAFANKLHTAMVNHCFSAGCGMELMITGSFGVATFPDDAQGSDELINASDKAMYRAKELGRNMVCGAGEIGSDDGVAI